MLLSDDIHDIFALINGKTVSFLVQNMQIISAYLLPHPPPSHSTSYPAKQPPLPSSEKGNHWVFFLTFVSLSYCLYISICDRYVTPQLLRVFYEFGWLVGCFGFNGPLRQYFSLYRAVFQREGDRGEKTDETKNVQTTPTRTYCKHHCPCPTIIQIVGRPGTGGLPRAIAQPDHPHEFGTGV